jgi:DHA1 family bicyclomycin/chloramphenicol resistance-like MFS transporter
LRSTRSGCAGFGLGALAAVVSGVLQDGTARPLAILVLAAMLASATALYGIALRARDAAARHAAQDT